MPKKARRTHTSTAGVPPKVPVFNFNQFFTGLSNFLSENVGPIFSNHETNSSTPDMPPKAPVFNFKKFFTGLSNFLSENVGPIISNLFEAIFDFFKSLASLFSGFSGTEETPVAANGDDFNNIADEDEFLASPYQSPSFANLGAGGNNSRMVISEEDKDGNEIGKPSIYRRGSSVPSSSHVSDDEESNDERVENFISASL